MTGAHSTFLHPLLYKIYFLTKRSSSIKYFRWGPFPLIIMMRRALGKYNAQKGNTLPQYGNNLTLLLCIYPGQPHSLLHKSLLFLVFKECPHRINAGCFSYHICVKVSPHPHNELVKLHLDIISEAGALLLLSCHFPWAYFCFCSLLKKQHTLVWHVWELWRVFVLWQSMRFYHIRIYTHSCTNKHGPLDPFILDVSLRCDNCMLLAHRP